MRGNGRRSSWVWLAVEVRLYWNEVLSYLAVRMMMMIMVIVVIPIIIIIILIVVPRYWFSLRGLSNFASSLCSFTAFYVSFPWGLQRHWFWMKFSSTSFQRGFGREVLVDSSLLCIIQGFARGWTNSTEASLVVWLQNLDLLFHAVPHRHGRLYGCRLE